MPVGRGQIFVVALYLYGLHTRMTFVCNFIFNIAHADLLSHHTLRSLHNGTPMASIRFLSAMNTIMDCIFIRLVSRLRSHMFITERHEIQTILFFQCDIKSETQI